MTEQDLLAQSPDDYMNEVQQGFFRELLLRPTTTLCIEAKEREELRERHQRAI